MMKVEIRLFATLRDGRDKVLEMEVEENTTVSKVLDIFKIKQEDVALLLINGRDGKFDARLHEGDYLSLFPPVGGG
nr:MoaD/ThiS family protein [Halocella sp. SP3-1]